MLEVVIKRTLKGLLILQSARCPVSRGEALQRAIRPMALVMGFLKQPSRHLLRNQCYSSFTPVLSRVHSNYSRRMTTSTQNLFQLTGI